VNRDCRIAAKAAPRNDKLGFLFYKPIQFAAVAHDNGVYFRICWVSGRALYPAYAIAEIA